MSGMGLALDSRSRGPRPGFSNKKKSFFITAGIGDSAAQLFVRLALLTVTFFAAERMFDAL